MQIITQATNCSPFSLQTPRWYLENTGDHPVTKAYSLIHTLIHSSNS